MIRPIHFLTDGEGTFVQRPGFLELALERDKNMKMNQENGDNKCGGTFSQQPRPVVEICSHVGMIRTQHLLVYRKGPLIQRISFVVLALTHE